MRYAIALAISVAASGAAAANNEHASCVEMMANAYKGVKLARGDVVEVNTFLFSQVRAKKVPIEQKDKTDAAFIAFEAAAAELIGALAETCEGIRSSSPE